MRCSLLNETIFILATFSMTMTTAHTQTKVAVVLTFDHCKQPRGVDGILLGTFRQEQFVPE